jgi:hypothetical protein
MRRVVVVLAAISGAWFLYRRRRGGDDRVVLAWEDGSEVALEYGSPGHARLVEIAGRALA